MLKGSIKWTLVAETGFVFGGVATGAPTCPQSHKARNKMSSVFVCFHCPRHRASLLENVDKLGSPAERAYVHRERVKTERRPVGAANTLN
jgi:hypothetical protein